MCDGNREYPSATSCAEQADTQNRTACLASVPTRSSCMVKTMVHTHTAVRSTKINTRLYHPVPCNIEWSMRWDAQVGVASTENNVRTGSRCIIIAGLIASQKQMRDQVKRPPHVATHPARGRFNMHQCYSARMRHLSTVARLCAEFEASHIGTQDLAREREREREKGEREREAMTKPHIVLCAMYIHMYIGTQLCSMPRHPTI